MDRMLHEESGWQELIDLEEAINVLPCKKVNNIKIWQL